MTYGWVILLILISFTALFQFGILDFNDLLPQQVMMPPPLEVQAYTVNDGTISLLLINNFFDPIQINPEGYKGTHNCNEIIDFSFTQGIINKTETFELNFTCGNVGKRIKSYLSFNYTHLGSNVDHIHTGFVKINNK